MASLSPLPLIMLPCFWLWSEEAVKPNSWSPCSKPLLVICRVLMFSSGAAICPWLSNCSLVRPSLPLLSKLPLLVRLSVPLRLSADPSIWPLLSAFLVFSPIVSPCTLPALLNPRVSLNVSVPPLTTSPSEALLNCSPSATSAALPCSKPLLTSVFAFSVALSDIRRPSLLSCGVASFRLRWARRIPSARLFSFSRSFSCRS